MPDKLLPWILLFTAILFEVAGITSMTSSSGEGQTQITLQFDLNRNIDGAALDVQSAISTAAPGPSSKPLPSIAVPVFYLFSAFAVILALKRLELSTAYAIWSGVGTALAAMIGITYFREPLTLFKIASLVLVILGVLGLSLAARQTN